MKILSIDTSTNNFSLAVSKDDNVLRYRNITLNKVLSSSIIPGIEKILKSVGWTIDQLDGYAVGLGPGSFTSLRVGLSTIKGLAFATGKPIVGVSSLDVIAHNIKDKGSQICVLCDAKRSLIYTAFYERDNKDLKRIGDYSLISVDELLRQLKGDVVFVGDGLGVYQDTLKEQYRTNGKVVQSVFASKSQWSPQAKQLARIAYKKFCKRKYTNIDQLAPFYLYPEDCQVRRKAPKGR